MPNNNSFITLFCDKSKMSKKLRIWLLTAIVVSLLVSPSVVMSTTVYQPFGGGDGHYRCTVDFKFEDPNGLAKGRKIHIRDAAGKIQKKISVGESVNFNRHSMGHIYVKSETGNFSFSVVITIFEFTECADIFIFYEKIENCSEGIKNCERLVYKTHYQYKN